MDWKNRSAQIFNKAKQQLFARSINYFSYIRARLTEESPLLSVQAFNQLLNKMGVFLTTQELRAIKDQYGGGNMLLQTGRVGDTMSGNDPCVKWGEFIRDLKWDMTDKVRRAIEEAWQLLEQGRGKVKADQVLQRYNAQLHPEWQSRTKSLEQIREQFSSAILPKCDQDGYLSLEGFENFCSELNCCAPLEREQYLVNLLLNLWGIRSSALEVTPKRLHELQLILYEKVREKSDGRTNEWKTAKKVLSFFDLEDCKRCSYPAFVQALDKLGCRFSDPELKALFSKYDIDHSGTLEYEQFSKLLMDIDINGMIKKENLLTTLGTGLKGHK